MRVHDHAFVVTAAHVVDVIQRGTGRFTVAIGGKLITIRRDRFVTRPNDIADIGLIPLRPPVVNAFVQSGALFLDGDSIDENEDADGQDVSNTLAHTYFAVGFPASRSQSRIQHAQRKIHVKTYSIRLTLAPTDSYPIGLERESNTSYWTLIERETQDTGLGRRGSRSGQVNPSPMRNISELCAQFRSAERSLSLGHDRPENTIMVDPVSPTTI